MCTLWGRSGRWGPILVAMTMTTTTTTTTTTTPRMFGIEAPVPAHQTPAARPQWVAPADPRNPLDMPRPAAPFEYGVPQEPTPEAGGQSLDFGLLAACAAVIAACTSPLWRRPRSVAMYTTTGERAPNDVEADTELATLSAAKKWQAVLAEIEEMDRAAAEAAEKAAAEEGTMSAKLKSVAVFSLPLAASAFILQAYFFGTPVAHLMNRNGWLFAHVTSGMLFGGIVVFSTLYEGLVILQGTPGVRRWWFERVPLVDGVVALPAVFMSIASGVCLSQTNFGSLYAAPKFVHLALETLLMFVAFWAVMDQSTQGPAREKCNEEWKVWMLTDVKPEKPNDTLQTRLWVNAVSSSFVVFIYWVMTTKPHFKLEDLF
mmetsp:Transcript_41242/g.69376  ORF Transcript_41242/g.69376 Transcript_41242/m.69376 type:complete len:373 (-) Transcript_41242:707-1825(-)